MGAAVETRVELQRAASFESFRRRLQGLAAAAAAGSAGAGGSGGSPRKGSSAKRTAAAAAALEPAGAVAPNTAGVALAPAGPRQVGPLHAGLGLAPTSPAPRAGRVPGSGAGAEEDEEDATDSAMHEAVAFTLREEQRQHLEGGDMGAGSGGSSAGGGADRGAAAGAGPGGGVAAAAPKPPRAGGAGRLLASVLPLSRAGGRAAAEAALRAADAFASGLASVNVELSVTLTRLEGSLLLWLPPPPSDRLWVSFLSPPQVRRAGWGPWVGLGLRDSGGQVRLLARAHTGIGYGQVAGTMSLGSAHTHPSLATMFSPLLLCRRSSSRCALRSRAARCATPRSRSASAAGSRAACCARWGPACTSPPPSTCGCLSLAACLRLVGFL
jgi:hypothetical protein